VTLSTINSNPPSAAELHIQAVRGFNRFYTRRIGVLDPYLGSGLSLTEVRVLYELAHRDQPTATELGHDLGLDAGYVSRILRRFETKNWLARVPSPADARQSLLALTNVGRQAFAPLQQKSRDEAAALLAPLADSDRHQLIDAMGRVQRLLDPTSPKGQAPVALLRAPQPGDMGGWSSSMAKSMPASTDGTPSSRRWWRTSWRSLCGSISPAGSAAGWPS